MIVVAKPIVRFCAEPGMIVTFRLNEYSFPEFVVNHELAVPFFFDGRREEVQLFFHNQERGHAVLRRLARTEPEAYVISIDTAAAVGQVISVVDHIHNLDMTQL
ncbi:MAG: hypothetical protein CO156_03020 [Candidatus Pacebacteria bacterium CG_4_9_14_3_um_filter_40_12]|nr:MAG: hypothetical protein COU64_00715 [Candidatus Pacebacteria bacterium CG10_big_fil_rev_8_21_14_0_10_40_26]PIZ79253.1 MAG: hypothetical protein COY01_02415 [Candidatus Pacebacteria bacterium CG_4_10_14_0_2_um_filter_40_20]PJA68908.1 MAG: hypothetical protein CO156_03020 [Candidatus Pacebacteria bacterium CG_4_9_14_3_um_filter_40_12]PJC42220.1 MAG: hypothetical protein CO041_01125 [Candidatus Pacebacteria bacterium CG_4_9_14_0_2_um_filter_40_15]